MRSHHALHAFNFSSFGVDPLLEFISLFVDHEEKGADSLVTCGDLGIGQMFNLPVRHFQCDAMLKKC